MVKHSIKTGLIILLMTFPLLLKGQTIQLSGTDNKVGVSGTSSLHDWEMELQEFKATASLSTNGNEEFVLEDAVFSADANNLSSDNSIMDNKAHDALEAEDHPEIRFTQKGSVPLQIGNDKSLTIDGSLRIAGETKAVQIKVSYSLSSDENLNISGVTKLKMTDFGMKPPKAMFGTIKTDDLVTVNFKLNLKP